MRWRYIKKLPVPDLEREFERELEQFPGPIEGPVEGEPVPETIEEIPDQAGNDEEETVGNDEVKPKKSHRKLWRILLIVLCVLVGLLLIFILLSRLAPGLLDPLLYSKEELQILRY